MKLRGGPEVGRQTKLSRNRPADRARDLAGGDLEPPRQRQAELARFHGVEMDAFAGSGGRGLVEIGDVLIPAVEQVQDAEGRLPVRGEL